MTSFCAALPRLSFRCEIFGFKQESGRLVNDTEPEVKLISEISLTLNTEEGFETEERRAKRSPRRGSFV